MEEYRRLVKGQHRDKWLQSFANELGQLASGVETRIPHGTETIKFIPYSQVPKNNTVTYMRIVCNICSQQQETHRTWLTCGGDRIQYHGAVATPTADIATAKILFDSLISTPGAQYLGLNIKDCYLNTHLESPEFIQFPMSLIPQEIINQYKLLPLVHNDYVHINISKGMYSLPQDGRAAHDLLLKNMVPHGYYPWAYTPGLWHHTYKPTIFVLCVDDFGVKYMCQEDANHLINSIKNNYRATVDWSGSKYCGIILDWNYPEKWLNIAVPGYVMKALLKLCHPMPKQPEHSPHWH
eukprot:14408882-Ditylum_brightwellii.AAC.1